MRIIRSVLRWGVVALAALLIDGAWVSANSAWYSLQVGAFTELANTERALDYYRDKGLDPFYQYEDTGSKGMWYRVYVGRYRTRERARESGETFMQQRVLKNYIVRTMADDVPQSDTSLETVEPARPDDDAQPVQEVALEQPFETPDDDSQDKDIAIDSASAAEPIAGTPAEADAEGVHLTLLDAIGHSLESNREIAVVSYEPKKAQAQMEGAQAVYDTRLFADTSYRRDPNLDSSITDIVTEDDMTTRAGVRKPLKTGGTLSTYLESRYGDQNNSDVDRSYKHTVAPTVELRQPLLNNIGSREEQAAIKIASHQAHISDAELKRKILAVTDRVVNAYWKLYLQRELVAINRTNLDMAEEVHRREAERFAGGLSQQLDVERARSNAQVRRSTWLSTLEAYQIAMERLKLLMNWGGYTIDTTALLVPIDVPRTHSVAIETHTAIERALANRPEIIKARQELMIREVDQDLAAHQTLPKLDFIGRYGISGYGDEMDDAWSDVSMGDDDYWEVGLQFEWEIGRRRAKSQLRKRSLGRRQANAQLMRIADDIKLDVKEILKRLSTLESEIQTNRLAKAAAHKVVEGEFTRFDIGQASNEELLRAQDLLAATSRSLVRAVVNYNITLHELESIQGRLPEGVAMGISDR